MSYLSGFILFIKHLINNRRMIMILAYHDFKDQYLGSYLGIVWAVIQPAAFIGVIWLVFTYGIRPDGAGGSTAVILTLLTGMIPWFFFAEGLTNSCSSIVANKFLVKKVSFSVNILPVVAVLSCLIIHLVLVLFIMLLFILTGSYPDLYWLQIPYYIICTILLLVGLGWLTSAARVFVKDIEQLITLLVQFGFWFTPVIWLPEKVPERFRFLLDLNPMVYIIQGFRDSFVQHIWFWERPASTLVFLIILSLILLFGATTFKKLTPHFGDVI
ncbi:ABC transporter permease [Francisella philomiragia]|nr:ABC transporter permease [Francisella philomiragia]